MRRRAERWVPPALQERGLGERIFRVEREREREVKRARSEAFRRREREAEARHARETAAREAAARAEATPTDANEKIGKAS